MDQRSQIRSGGLPMGKRKSKEAVSEAGVQAYPPRFAAEAMASPHRIEQEVQHELLSQPGFRFASLVIRRLGNGVCLQGVLEVDDNSPDVCAVAQRVAGVDRVLNHLVISGSHDVPPKG